MSWEFDDATTQKINFGDVLDFTAASQTISAWIYPRSFNALDSARVIDKSQFFTGGYIVLIASSGPANHIEYIVPPGGVISDANAITLNQWQHIAVSYNGSNATFYRDGVAFGSPAMTDIPSGNTTPLYIGNNGAGTRSFDGNIGGLNIWDTALNASEIAAMARGVSPLSIRYANLKLCCPMWGNNSTTEPDFSTSRLSGIVDGAMGRANNAPTTTFTRKVPPIFEQAAVSYVLMPQICM